MPVNQPMKKRPKLMQLPTDSMVRAQQELLRSVDLDASLNTIGRRMIDEYNARYAEQLSQVIVDNGSEEMEEEEEPIIYDDLFDPVYLPVNVAPQRDGPRIERCFAGPTDTLYKFDLPLTPVPAGVNYQNYNTYMDCRPMTRVKPNPKYDDKPLLEDNIIPHVVPSGEDEMEPNQPDEPEESEESEGSEESEESEPQEIPPGGPRLERFSSDDEVEIKSGSSVASDEAHRQDDFKDDANGDSDKENVENMEM